MKNKLLEGKLVVSIEQAVAAPYCSVKLADAGARIIKVERKRETLQDIMIILLKEIALILYG